MSNETSKDEQIERYLADRMSPSEREQFEATVSADMQLRRSLRIEQAIAKGIATERSTLPLRHSDMRARAIDAIGRIAPSTPPPVPTVEASGAHERSRRSRGGWITGAALLLMFGIGGGLVMQSDGESSPPLLEPSAKSTIRETTIRQAPVDRTPAIPQGNGGTIDAATPAAVESMPAAGAKEKRDDAVKSRRVRTTPGDSRSAVGRSNGDQQDRQSKTTESPASAKPPRTFNDSKVDITVDDESVPPK